MRELFIFITIGIMAVGCAQRPNINIGKSLGFTQRTGTVVDKSFVTARPAIHPEWARTSVNDRTFGPVSWEPDYNPSSWLKLEKEDGRFKWHGVWPAEYAQYQIGDRYP